eukprot:8076320-Pyramimonas_sp.AAC.1
MSVSMEFVLQCSAAVALDAGKTGARVDSGACPEAAAGCIVSPQGARAAPWKTHRGSIMGLRGFC